MRTLIAIPCMDYCPTDFLRALLSLEIVGDAQFTFAQSSLIYDARNTLAGVAIDNGFDRVLWLDSDMTFETDMMRRMSEHLDLGREFVTGLYFTRKPPQRPVIYNNVYVTNPGQHLCGHADNYDDYPRDELFTVQGCGFGCVMTSVDLLRRIRDACGQPFAPLAGFGEDLSFCLNAKHVGAQLWCDSSIRLGHIGQAVYSEESFLISRKGSAT